MSYARFCDESDVYVYSDGENINCCGCRLGPDAYGSWVSQDFDEICEHLLQHIEVGHKVPGYCIERLLWEAMEGMWGKEKFELVYGYRLSRGEFLSLLTQHVQEEEDAGDVL
jgi:hypothetical protein